jgi:Fe-S cluster assembly iron-binding protein IscA
LNLMLTSKLLFSKKLGKSHATFLRVSVVTCGCAVFSYACSCHVFS